MNEPKVYNATIRFGSETETDDCTGTSVRVAGAPDISAVRAALPAFTGSIDQVPPAYSAKSVDGTRAYDAARQGAPLELAPVRVIVHRWDIAAVRDDEIDVVIACGAGTYIRALARDLGRATGSAAHLAALRRTNSGPFGVADAFTLEQLGELHPPVRRLEVVARA